MVVVATTRMILQMPQNPVLAKLAYVPPVLIQIGQQDVAGKRYNAPMETSQNYSGNTATPIGS